MLEFLKLPLGFNLILTVLVLFNVVSQTIALIMSCYRWEKNKKTIRKTENIFELFLLLIILIYSFVHGHLVMARANTIFIPIKYEFIRMVTVFLLIAIAIYISINKKRPWPLLSVLPAVVLLPYMEIFSGELYPWLVVFSLIFFFCRSIYISIMRYNEIHNGLSSLAVKNAMDTLHSGILFCEQDGHILLINKSMQNLMTSLTGKVQRDGLMFYDLLQSQSITLENIENVDGIACVAPDGRAWLFSKRMLKIQHKSYIMISTSDITEQWELIEELKYHNEELNQRSDELKEMLANLPELSYKKEIEIARMRAHDILGNRLSLILRSFHSSDIPDNEMLISITEGLFDEMKVNTRQTISKNELASLCETFLSIGVKINIDGDLPENNRISKLFIGIIREAITNAVRHGFATEINVELQYNEDSYFLTVTDNGHKTTKKIKERGGISGMKSRVAEQNGELNISTLPSFTISAKVPKRSDYV